MMIAQLPMYLRPGNRDAHLALWELIRAGLRLRGIEAPEHLDDMLAYDAAWEHPELCLSQICNLPLRGPLKDKVTRIGACDFGLPGCAPGYYNSLFVVHEDHPAQKAEDLQDATMAYNDALSHSGWGAPWLWAENRGLRFRPVLRSGAHVASIAAVAEGRVEFATIDAQSFRVLLREDPNIIRLKVIGMTDCSPGQTFCTRAGVDPAPYFAAIDAAIETLPRRYRDRLGLRGIVALPDASYDLPLPPEPGTYARG
ncbi:phosphate/phosphite/phosphonate ABC transporter substrate-binding protein [Celeribacter neptunius]|uniref:ABC transporter, phosphonate, substrate-binding protein n=1 Tax=Celeribacter neptunius TaxID=588602 RepID=A0A1I3IYX6_9RHOB|nr:PhnD/SsuA/transferrin family substrate-binding protein [Celeribacter neptunius]SFI53036.1 ABC transporter, phosphonate, substrate-binding protein [Celeribacter neptunius]